MNDFVLLFKLRAEVEDVGAETSLAQAWEKPDPGGKATGALCPWCPRKRAFAQPALAG